MQCSFDVIFSTGRFPNQYSISDPSEAISTSAVCKHIHSAIYGLLNCYRAAILKQKLCCMVHLTNGVCDAHGAKDGFELQWY